MPRLTNRVFTDLAIWMAGFGLFIGLIFPPFCVILGLPQREVISPSFFTATVLAGLLVGAANFALVQGVVGTRLKRLTTHMVRVQRQLVTATRSADWSGCNPLECALPVDSEDEIGRSAVAFNALIGTLAHSHAIESATRGFTRVVASHLELDALARDSLATILKDTGATAGILLVEEEQGLKPLATVGIRDPEQVAANAQVTAALRSGQTLRLDVAAEQVVVDSVLLDQTAREVIVVPLSFKDVPLGALVLASTNPLAPGTELLIGHFQTDLGLALSNALSHHRLERLAALDPLTDAYNRRFGFVRLQEEFGRALRVSSPLGVLMVDLDHFKGVNDTYGHLLGDRILRAAAASIRRVCREGDILMRYGGEEFMVVVPGASEADLLDIAERIRRSIAATEVLDGDRRVSVTASIGAVTYPSHDVASATELVAAADSALYTSKQMGRDRVTLR